MAKLAARDSLRDCWEVVVPWRFESSQAHQSLASYPMLEKGLVCKISLTGVRFPSMSPGSRSPTGSRHIVQGDDSVGSNPSASTTPLVATGSRGRFRFCLLGVRIPQRGPACRMVGNTMDARRAWRLVLIKVEQWFDSPAMRIRICLLVSYPKHGQNR